MIVDNPNADRTWRNGNEASASTTHFQDIKEVETLIADGLQPRCPVCGSALEITRGEGLSGALAFQYACSKEDCPLRPGLARISAYGVLLKAVQQRIVQLTVTALGSITAVALLAFFTGLLSFSRFDSANSQLSIVEGVSVPLIVWDADDTVTEINTAACRFVGAPRTELIGKTPAYLRARIAELIENPVEWMQEQNKRELLTYDDLLLEPSNVPMILAANHPAYTGNWRIETIKTEIDGQVFWVTRYFEVDG